MSAQKVRGALQAALAGMSPALATAYENVAFTPTPGTPYQRVTFVPAEPRNNEMNRYYMERGFMQVDLFYPIGGGAGAAVARFELLRSTFYRGAAFVQDGLTVTIDRTPGQGVGQVDGDRWFLPVRIRYFAHVTS